MARRENGRVSESACQEGDLAHFFLEVFPKTIPGRLAWYASELGLDPYRLLGLAGVSRQGVKKAGPDEDVDWAATIRHHAETAQRVSNLMGRLLWYFDYDTAHLRARLRDAAKEDYFVVRPDRPEPVSIRQLSDAERNEALFPAIVNEEFEALLAYLAIPASRQK